MSRPSCFKTTIFGELRFDYLLETSARAKIPGTLTMIFNQCAQATTPPPGVEKVYAFEALCLAEGIINLCKAL